MAKSRGQQPSRQSARLAAGRDTAALLPLHRPALQQQQQQERRPVPHRCTEGQMARVERVQASLQPVAGTAWMASVS